MIKAIIFDFFGVLVTEGFKQFREDFFADDEQKDNQAIDLINQVDAGLINTADFTARLADLASIEPQKVSQMLGNNKPNQALLKYIHEELKGKYKLSILSNSSENYPSRLLESEDMGLFDDILLSYRYGIVKPQQEIYELAAERLEVQTTECVFIDDSPGHCQGAQRAGMKTVHYQTFSLFKNELEAILKAAPTDN